MLEIYDEIHNWLMIGSDLNFMKELLQTAELRLDSEVLLVLKKYLQYGKYFQIPYRLLYYII